MKLIAIFFLIVSILLIPSIVEAVCTNNDDGFSTTCTVSATDGLSSVTCTTEHMDFQELSGSDLIGSFDALNDTGTNRTPMRINLTTSPNIGAGANNQNCEWELFRNQTCAQPQIVGVGVSRSGVQGELVVSNDITDQLRGHIGELCFNLTATATDGVGSPVRVGVKGALGIAPLLNDTEISSVQINLFRNLTVTHNLEEAGDIERLDMSVTRDSDNSTIKSGLQDTTPANNFSFQLITFSTNPTLDTSHRVTYTGWRDNSTDRTRFSRNSTMAINRQTPRTDNFSINSTIFCSSLNAYDGISLYNRGERVNRSGAILFNDQTNWSVTIGVTFDARYRKNGDSVNQFSNTSFDISNAFWNRSTIIPNNAAAIKDTVGQPYDIYFQVDNDADSTELLNCTYSNTFNLSNLLLTELSFNQPKYYLGDTFNITTLVNRARGTPLGGATYLLEINDSSGNLRFSENGVTNSTGNDFHSIAGALEPTGTWTVELIMTEAENNNNTNGDLHELIVAKIAGRDPVTIDCDGKFTNELVSCSFRGQDLEAISVTNGNFTFNVTNTTPPTWIFNGSTAQEIEEIGFGLYYFNFTPSVSGNYWIIVSNLNDGNATGISTVRISDQSGLDTNQNATLYQINTTINSQTWKDSIAERIQIYLTNNPIFVMLRQSWIALT